MGGEERNRRDLHRARWRQDWESWEKLMAERDEHGWHLYPWMREVDGGLRAIARLVIEEEN